METKNPDWAETYGIPNIPAPIHVPTNIEVAIINLDIGLKLFSLTILTSFT